MQSCTSSSSGTNAIRFGYQYCYITSRVKQGDQLPRFPVVLFLLRGCGVNSSLFKNVNIPFKTIPSGFRVNGLPGASLVQGVHLQTPCSGDRAEEERRRDAVGGMGQGAVVEGWVEEMIFAMNNDMT